MTREVDSQIRARKARLNLDTPGRPEEEGQSYLSRKEELSRLSLELGHPDLSEQLDERKRRLLGQPDSQSNDEKTGCLRMFAIWRWFYWNCGT